MPWLLRLGCVMLLVSIPLSFETERALACDCGYEPLVEAVDGADAIFSGRVTTGGRWGGAELEVSRVWKGDVGATTQLYFSGGGTSCEMWLDEGEEYLVFAYRGGQNNLYTHFCSWTMELKYAEDTIGALGEGRPPGTGEVVVPRRTPESTCDCLVVPLLEEIAESDAVFAGRVVRSYESSWELQVSRVWKGNVQETTELYVYGVYDGCSVGLRKGEEYLVFAYSYYSVDPLITYGCTRTKILSRAQEDLAVLGEGQPPGTGEVRFTPQEAASPGVGDTGSGLTPGRCAQDSWSPGLPAAGAVALVVLVFVILRRRARQA